MNDDDLRLERGSQAGNAGGDTRPAGQQADFHATQVSQNTIVAADGEANGKRTKVRSIQIGGENSILTSRHPPPHIASHEPKPCTILEVRLRATRC